MVIHDDNPFAPEVSDATRRFRGRLANPVTIVTSGDTERRTGLTVSSLMVFEGDPGLVHAIVTPNSDLFDVAADTGRFVVHIAEAPHAGLSDVFAGIRPSPGGMFHGTELEQSEWGPVIVNLKNRLYCTTRETSENGWSGLVIGSIDSVELADLSQPLVHFRGAYRTLQ